MKWLKIFFLKRNIKYFIIIIIFYLILKSFKQINNEYEYLTDYSEININEKYIMYRCDKNLDKHECGGWGDRIKGIMSAYWWAKITGRKLLININKPCDLSKILEPNEINWNMKLNKKNIKNYSEVILNKFNDDNFKNKLRYIDIRKFHSDKNLIILKTNRNFVWSFANTKVPGIIKNILKFGYNNTNEIDMPNTYRYVNSKLFKLTPKLDNYLKQFYTELKPNKMTTLICVQIRTRNARNNPKINDELYLALNKIKYFWRFLNLNFIPKVKNDYRIFISTDNISIRNDSIKRYGLDKVVYNKGNDIINIDYIKENNECPIGIEQTFKDFYSFQYCDMAVVTENSQFGRFGIWNKGQVPKQYYSFNGREFKKIINFSQQNTL